LKAEAIVRSVVKIADSIVSGAIMVIIVALLAFAGYALWDSKQIYSAADNANYAAYKPLAEDGRMGFKEIQAINPEVIAWLEVYGTNIDYPVTQSEDNSKYVKTDAFGRYSLSGAIFLDADNSKDFSDFNSLLYGHHMEKNKLFGEIGSFKGESMFDSRRYGNLYFEEQDHGIEFFAYLQTDAYNRSVFTIIPPDTKTNHGDGSAQRIASDHGDGTFDSDHGDGSAQRIARSASDEAFDLSNKTMSAAKEKRSLYLNNIYNEAIHTRDVGVTGSDRIILLVTCSTDSTNGRDILIGRITDEVFADPFSEPGGAKGGVNAGYNGGLASGILPWLIVPAIALVSLIIILISVKRRTR